MIKNLLLILTCLVLPLASPTAAVAGPNPLYTFSVTWDMPTQRESGEILTPDEIKGYVVHVLDPAGVVSEIVVDGALSTAATYPAEVPGSYVFSVKAVDTGNVSSKYSIPINKDIKSPIAQPTGVTIVVTCEGGSQCTFNIPPRVN